jgi:short-subunit dehydrogenase
MNKKVILITGTSAGIGASIASILHKKGHIVYGLSRRHIDVPYHTFSLDITKEVEVNHVIQSIIDQEGRLDVLINNAGMGISGTVENTSSKESRDMFDVNFFASVHLMKQVIPIMRKQHSGKIINISSLASSFPLPFQAFYSASKAALTSVSLALYNEVSPFGIDLCVILPGDIKTSFTQARKRQLNVDPSYGKRVDQSIETMAHDEQHGMNPNIIGFAVERLITKKRMPKVMTLGLKYNIMFFIQRIVSTKLLLYVIGNMYGFKKQNKHK